MRGPSAYTGIVGLRATTGMISRDGIAPKNLNFDSAGPMARSVTDMALMLSVIGGKDAADPLNLKVWSEEEKRYPAKNGHIDFTKYLDANALKGKKLGVVRDFFGGDPEIDARAEKALADMRKLGATTSISSSTPPLSRSTWATATASCVVCRTTASRPTGSSTSPRSKTRRCRRR